MKRGQIQAQRGGMPMHVMFLVRKGHHEIVPTAAAPAGLLAVHLGRFLPRGDDRVRWVRQRPRLHLSLLEDFMWVRLGGTALSKANNFG